MAGTSIDARRRMIARHFGIPADRVIPKLAIDDLTVRQAIDIADRIALHTWRCGYCKSLCSSDEDERKCPSCGADRAYAERERVKQ